MTCSCRYINLKAKSLTALEKRGREGRPFCLIWLEPSSTIRQDTKIPLICCYLGSSTKPKKSANVSCTPMLNHPPATVIPVHIHLKGLQIFHNTQRVVYICRWSIYRLHTWLYFIGNRRDSRASHWTAKRGGPLHAIWLLANSFLG